VAAWGGGKGSHLRQSQSLHELPVDQEYSKNTPHQAYPESRVEDIAPTPIEPPHRRGEGKGGKKVVSHQDGW